VGKDAVPRPPNRFGKFECPAIGGSKSKVERFFYTLALPDAGNDLLVCFGE
jgi:hypothetical protein